MPMDRFMIAPLRGGLETDVKPWMVPNDAFARMDNAYIFRDRIRKRFGSRYMNSSADQTTAQLLSRARIGLTGVVIGMTDAMGDFSGMVPGLVYVVDQKFLVSDGATSEVMNVVVLGTPGVMDATGPSTTHTYDTSTGAVVIVGSVPLATVYFINETTPSAGVGMTDGAGMAIGIAPGNIFGIGQLFSIAGEIYTVDTLGFAQMNSTGAGIGFFNTNTGEYAFNGSPANARIYFYPALPIMGLPFYETTDELNFPTFAFDTEFAYKFNAGAWERLGTAIWSGTDSDFFWATTWQGALASDRLLFVTNNVAVDQIKYWDGATWFNFAPQVNAAGDTLQTARILVVYQNRLIALSTTEKISGNNVTFTNRARWAAFGDPRDVDAWNSSIPGKGNDIVASTMEDIISCEFIKNRLIVFFESSTWELAFTNNQAQPFTWQKLNTELGCESTHSVVPFDKIALAVGNVGIHACNGTNVERIDQKIPDSVWTVHDETQGIQRIYGIRDYYSEQVYWTFPTVSDNQFSSTYPSRILVYNYKLDSWAFNDDSITAFGYFYAANQSSISWDSEDITWDNSVITWDSGAGQALNQLVLAGNQEGYIFIIDTNLTQNAGVLQVTEMNINLATNMVQLVIVNHNLNVSSLDDAEFIYLTNLNGLTPVPPLTAFNGIYEVNGVIDLNTITIDAPDLFDSLLTEEYLGGATAARVSQIDILTKQFNFYIEKDRNAHIQKVDFLVDRTDSGVITVDYYLGSSSQGTVDGAFATGAQLGINVLETSPYLLYPFEAQQDRLWHPVYFQADSNAIQLRIYLTPEQLENYDIATSDFQLHAMTFYAQPTSSRAQ